MFVDEAGSGEFTRAFRTWIQRRPGQRSPPRKAAELFAWSAPKLCGEPLSVEPPSQIRKRFLTAISHSATSQALHDGCCTTFGKRLDSGL